VWRVKGIWRSQRRFYNLALVRSYSQISGSGFSECFRCTFSEESKWNTHKIINVLRIFHMQVVKRKITKVILLEALQPGTRDVCISLQERQYRYNVTPRHVCATVLVDEKQWALHNCVCVCSLRYPECNAHAPYCHLWPAPLCISFHIIS
jgi:hypothetical protein